MRKKKWLIIYERKTAIDKKYGRPITAIIKLITD